MRKISGVHFVSGVLIISGSISIILGIVFIIEFYQLLADYYTTFWDLSLYNQIYYIIMCLCPVNLGITQIVVAWSLLKKKKSKEDDLQTKNVLADEVDKSATKKIVCPNCQKSVPAGSKFCNHCGQKIGRYKIKNIKEKPVDKEHNPEKSEE
jgi:ribosomal protein L40E